jgi:ABC-type uncharacterized transport system fused permease/ATPase subunit
MMCQERQVGYTTVEKVAPVTNACDWMCKTGPRLQSWLAQLQRFHSAAQLAAELAAWGCAS